MSGTARQPARVTSTLKGAAYIADFLVQQKVPYIFGLCGQGLPSAEGARCEGGSRYSTPGHGKLRPSAIGAPHSKLRLGRGLN